MSRPTTTALLKAILTATQSGFDTHAAQRDMHSGLLSEFAGAVAAFFEDLKAAKLSERVALLAFSEFGRTIRENGSGGTDHGTAGVVFLAGPGVARRCRRQHAEPHRPGRRRTEDDHRLPTYLYLGPGKLAGHKLARRRGRFLRARGAVPVLRAATTRSTAPSRHALPDVLRTGRRLRSHRLPGRPGVPVGLAVRDGLIDRRTERRVEYS